jgi:hypothetical protein
VKSFNSAFLQISGIGLKETAANFYFFETFLNIVVVFRIVEWLKINNFLVGFFLQNRHFAQNNTEISSWY